MADMHDAIYDVLVRECGAIESNRALFKERVPDLAQPMQAHLFGGQLGLEGAFMVGTDGTWFVSYPAADRTEKRERMVTRANAALNELQGR